MPARVQPGSVNEADDALAGRGPAARQREIVDAFLTASRSGEIRRVQALRVAATLR